MSSSSDEEYVSDNHDNLNEELLARWTLTDTDNVRSTVNCPKCSEPGIRNEEINPLFGECLKCHFIFCTNCKEDFHGNMECLPEPELLNPEPNVDTETVPVTTLTTTTPNPETSSNIQCNICFENTPVDNTTDLGCAHLYCNPCVQGYFETLIKEGSVHSLNCPSTNCGQSVATDLLKQLISPEVFDIYDSKLLDEILQDEPEIVCCPKPGCGKRFHSQPEYGYCESCDYMFCTNCNQMYHGLTVCGESEEERLRQIKEHIAATTEEERMRLEKEEQEKRRVLDDQSNGFINKVCKRCPQCRANIEKTEGCHHMTCTRCNTHFCWLCLTFLNSSNPYPHFQNNNTGCQLFIVPAEEG